MSFALYNAWGGRELIKSTKWFFAFCQTTRTKTTNLSYQKKHFDTLFQGLKFVLKKELFSPRGSVKKFCKFSSKGDQIYRNTLGYMTWPEPSDWPMTSPVGYRKVSRHPKVPTISTVVKYGYSHCPINANLGYPEFLYYSIKLSLEG